MCLGYCLTFSNKLIPTLRIVMAALSCAPLHNDYLQKRKSAFSLDSSIPSHALPAFCAGAYTLHLLWKLRHQVETAAGMSIHVMF